MTSAIRRGGDGGVPGGVSLGLRDGGILGLVVVVVSSADRGVVDAIPYYHIYVFYYRVELCFFSVICAV